MADLGSLLGGTDPETGIYRPLFFRLPADAPALGDLLKTVPSVRVYDRIQAQLKELAKSLSPQIRMDDEGLRSAMDSHLAGRPLNEYGTWVYYPWSKTLVHLLDEEEFIVVRTDRNRNKITREEQAELAKKKVGVIGLSVGQSVSLAMALERSFGEIRLADFDTLDLSNLNRIRTGTHNLGLNKAIITAREIAEIDPFLKVICFTDGLTARNMDAFFTEGGKLDVVVEECDGVDIKILARQKAKALGIPVVMDMSDRGCLDVERFDLEPGRPILHGWIDHLDLEAAKRPMSAEEKVPYMLPFTGVETLSPRMKASVIELGQTISTWPQLATSVVLGGALAGDAVRRIALDQFHASGRWHVDLEELIASPTPSVPPSPTLPGIPVPDHANMAAIGRSLLPVAGDALKLPEETVRELVQAGSLAPSAGNMQPWQFLWQDKRLLLFRAPARLLSHFDPNHLIADLGLGACMENVVLKAHELGLNVVTSSFPAQDQGALVAMFEFHGHGVDGAEPHVADRLATMIPKRRTNRSFSDGSPIPGAMLEPVRQVLDTADACTTHWIQDREELKQLASLYGQAERFLLMHSEGHREYFRNTLRWTEAEAAHRRDGIDIASYALPPMAEAAMKVMADPRAMDLTRAWGAGQGLGMIPAWALSTSAAVVALSLEKDAPYCHLKAGRIIQRAWLMANEGSVAVQPMDAFCRIANKWAQAPESFSVPEQIAIRDLLKGLHGLCCGATHGNPVLLMRFFNPVRPAHPSYRHKLDRILTTRSPIKS